MELCLNIRDYLEDPSRPLHQQVDEAVEVARKATEWGYTAIYCPHRQLCCLIPQSGRSLCPCSLG